MKSRTGYGFYIATSLAYADRQQALKAALEARGHHCLFDWGSAPRLQPDDVEGLARRSNAELEAVRHATFVVGLFPGGRGTQREIGAAQGLRTPVFLWAASKGALDEGYDYPCVFDYADFITLILGEEQALLDALDKAFPPHPDFFRKPFSPFVFSQPKRTKE